MGLREDIQNALGGIASSVYDATHTLRIGDSMRGVAVQCSSSDYGDSVSEDAPREVIRCVVSAADFATLDEGDAVSFDDEFRVVTSVAKDVVGATLKIGLSKDFSETACEYGTGGESFALDILICENGVTDPYAGAIAPTYANGYTVAIRREDWPFYRMPFVGDSVRTDYNGDRLLLKASSVTRKDGWFVINARCRQ